VTTARPTPVPPGSCRLSLEELAERAGATVDRLERLVELGILAPAEAEEPFRRHSETFTVEHRVVHGEDDLERAGIHRRAGADPPAIVFLNISGYTRLTEELTTRPPQRCRCGLRLSLRMRRRGTGDER
jgi:hypothetical protein